MDTPISKTAFDNLHRTLIAHGYHKEAAELLAFDTVTQQPQTAPANAGRFESDRPPQNAAPKQAPQQSSPISPIGHLNKIIEHLEKSPSFKNLPDNVLHGLLKIKAMTKSRFASEKEAMFGSERDPLKDLENILLKFDKTGPDPRKVPADVTKAVDSLNMIVDKALSSRPKEKNIFEKGQSIAKGVADKGMGVARGVAEKGQDFAKVVADKGQQLKKDFEDKRNINEDKKTYNTMQRFEEGLATKDRQNSAMSALKSGLSRYKPYREIFTKLPARIIKELENIGLGISDLGNYATTKVASHVNNTLLNYLRDKEAYSNKELSLGKKEEKEHLDVYNTFAKVMKRKKIKNPLTKEQFVISVAKAHLKEDPKYYTKIKETFSKKAMDFSGIGNLITPEGKLDERELSRVIRLAIAAELDAIHLYELIVDSSDNETIKKVLQDISNEEKVHASELNELLSKFDKDNEKFIEDGKKEVKDLIKET